MEQQKTNYGNWISLTLLRILYGTSAVLLLLFALSFVWPRLVAVTIFMGIVAAAMLAMSVYMHVCHHEFSFEGGRLMSKFHDFLMEHLDWDGHGTLLDIGCGSAALSVRCAKEYPEAQMMAIDYWGFGWDYAKAQCERNAAIEGVDGRIRFEKGDASKLDFADETFDAAVSNFVFHEVRTQPDKCQVVREALRVVKKGGCFAFQDLFPKKQLYGNMEEFVAQLRAEGITEIHYIANVEQMVLIPTYMRAPWMMAEIGIIYGRK